MTRIGSLLSRISSRGNKLNGQDEDNGNHQICIGAGHSSEGKNLGALNEEILQREYGIEHPSDTHILKDLKNYAKKRYVPNKVNMKNMFFSFFPIIQWLSKYKFREYFLKDLIGGITLGIVLVPQTMGYSLNGVIF